MQLGIASLRCFNGIANFIFVLFQCFINHIYFFAFTSNLKYNLTFVQFFINFSYCRIRIVYLMSLLNMSLTFSLVEYYFYDYTRSITMSMRTIILFCEKKLIS